MSENRLIRNVSSSTFQLVLNQVFGLLIFYALSKGLDKSLFGQLNWAFAVFLSVFGVLAFGIDQLMVTKIAAGFDKQSIFSAYLLHVLISGFVFYGFLILAAFLFSNQVSNERLLLFIGAGRLFLFISTPFKQVAMGLERFTSLLYMSVVSNIARGIGLIVLLLLNIMTVWNVLIVLVAGDLAELLVSIYIGRKLLVPPLKISWDKQFQLSLLKEALPQAGSFVFSAIMARFDWILIGILVSKMALAEYSFAWKLFEVSTLPLLIIAPIMIPMFTRLFARAGSKGEPSFFLEWQVMVACFVALVLNICWVPVVEFISDGKYGAVNTRTILLLSVSMPVLYINNYLWTINFAQGKLKMIFRVMAISFTVNVIGCIVLIPLYEKEGAAIANLLAVLVQLVCYLKQTKFSLKGYRSLRLFIWPLLAVLFGFLITNYVRGFTLQIILGVLIYPLAVFATKQVRYKDWKTLQSLYK